jgi:hypothetical protein
MEELRVSKLLGGALAAVTGAVLASFTGVQGTLAGAAVTSIFMAVTTTLYTHSLSFAHRQMRRTMARRTSGDRDDDRDRDGDGDADAAGPGTGPIRWQRVTIAAAAAFAIALAAITVVEAVAKQPLASLVWDRPRPEASTSIGVVAGGERRSTRPASRAPGTSVTSLPGSGPPRQRSAFPPRPCRRPRLHPPRPRQQPPLAGSLRLPGAGDTQSAHVAGAARPRPKAH